MATILIVDDSATNRALLVRLLDSDERRIIEASNGAEALGLVLTESPDLILTDVLMPKVDGYELERQLRADRRTAGIPVIFHTAAYTSSEMRQLVGRSDQLFFLPKPSEIDAVLATVSRALASGARTSSTDATTTDEHQHLAVLNAKLLQKVRELELAERKRQSLLAHLVQVQEDERERIAGDIHDDSIQAMTAVAMRLEMLRSHLSDPEALDRHSRLQETVRLTIERLRHLLFQLHPTALDRAGLAATIKLYLEHTVEGIVDRHVVEDQLSTEPSPELRALLYRIAQEALANVAKHAQATEVTVELASREGGIQLRVIDDGRGFDVEEAQVPRRGHLGLISMRQRAELAGGWWRVDSADGVGTTVEAWLPTGGAAGWSE
jgi:signal transduction histidine kinase